MNSPELTIPDSLSKLAQALHEGERKQISISLASCRRSIGIEATDEEISAMAIVFVTTGGGLSPTSLEALRGTSKEGFKIGIRWEIVLNSLAQKGAILLKRDQAIDLDQPLDSVLEPKSALHNTQVPLEQCSIILQPPYCGVVERDEEPKGFASNREYIRASLDFLDAHIYNVQSHDDNPSPPSKALLAKYTHLRAKAQQTDPPPPLELLCKSYELGKTEWLIILLVLKNELGGASMDTKTAGELLHGGDILEQYDFGKHFDSDGVLVRSGIVIKDDSFRKGRDQIIMPLDLVNWLITAQGEPPASIKFKICSGESIPFESNDDYVTAWHDLAHAFLENVDNINPPRASKYFRLCESLPPALEIPQIQQRLQYLVETGDQFPLGKLIQEHQLDCNECFIVALGIYARTREFTIPLQIVLDSLSGPDPILHLKNESYFAPDAPLIRHGILELVPEDRAGSSLQLSDQAISRILGNKNHVSVSKHSTSLYELRKPSHDLSSVVLDANIRETIETALESISPEMTERMEKWGVRQITATRPPESLTILLFGLPGVGKTLTSHWIAQSLGKDLFIVEAERILSVWHSKSEHNLQNIFNSYRKLQESSDNPPLMLMNEADQLLSRRSGASESSTSMTEHRMQNILLENLENFAGVLIATSNLVNALDEAFSRRFDIKLELPMPDTEARFSIWQEHIPPDVPLADVDVYAIAESFIFSGGQIAVASANAIRTAIRRGDHLTQADIVRACEQELSGSFDHSIHHGHKKIIGFVA